MTRVVHSCTQFCFFLAIDVDLASYNRSSRAMSRLSPFTSRISPFDSMRAWNYSCGRDELIFQDPSFAVRDWLRKEEKREEREREKRKAPGFILTSARWNVPCRGTVRVMRFMESTRRKGEACVNFQRLHVTRPVLSSRLEIASAFDCTHQNFQAVLRPLIGLRIAPSYVGACVSFALCNFVQSRRRIGEQDKNYVLLISPFIFQGKRRPQALRKDASPFVARSVTWIV